MTSSNNKHKKNTPWQARSIEQRYENPWISVSHHEVTAPTGKEGVYGVVHFKNVAIGIVPIDKYGFTWLVGQSRYTLKQYSWEIPEGGAPHHESALGAAQRELREETGIVAKRWTSLLKLNTSNSVTDELARSFIAQDLRHGLTQPDDTEVLQIKRLPIEEAVNMAFTGEITDSIAMASLLKVGLLIKNNQLQI